MARYLYCDIRELLKPSRQIVEEETAQSETRGEEFVRGFQNIVGGLFDAFLGRVREIAKPMATVDQCATYLSEKSGEKKVTDTHLEGYNGLVTIRTTGSGVCEYIAKGKPFEIDDINHFKDVCESVGGSFIQAK